MTASQAIEPTERSRHRRSHSQFNDYLHCSWAFRLKRINRLQEKPSVWLSGGKAFHSVSEDFDRATWQENDLSQWSDHEQWEAGFDQHFEALLQEEREKNPGIDETQWRTAGRKTKDKPDGEDIDWWRTAGRQFITKYVDWRVATNDTLRIAHLPDGGPAIEVEMHTPLGGVPMSSYADRVFQDQDTGELLLTDMKSGSRTPDTPMQLATYAIQIERIFRRPIVWGAFYDARKGLLSEPIDLTRFDQDNLGYVYRTLDRAAEEGIFLPNIGSHCKSCGLRDFCIWQGGTEPTEEQV